MLTQITKSPALIKRLRMNTKIHGFAIGKVSMLSVLLAVLVTALSLGLAPTTDGADDPPMFGRMFPDLPAYQIAQIGGTTPLQTLQALTAGAPSGPLFDPNLAAGPPRGPTDPNDDNPDNVPSFFTYFGQFLDHDMILDKLPLPDSFVDPATIPNFRDPRMNLDSVYLGGPDTNPELYQADGKHFIVNAVNDRDLPRDSAGNAIVGEKRNDENQVIAQIHVAFLRAHNRLIDQGYNYQQARQLMKWRYQWIIVHEFLKDVIQADVYADVFRPDGSIVTRFYSPHQAQHAVMPVEFSVAAYRFGHSQVRKAYIVAPFDNSVPGTAIKLQVFNGTDADLHGGRPITSTHVIFWPNFLPIVDSSGNIRNTGQFGTGQPVANIGRKIDTLLSSGLFVLPIPGAEPAGTSILALRNLQRALEYGLASGQRVAVRLNQDLPTNLRFPVWENTQIGAQTADANGVDHLSAVLSNPAYDNQAPLWLYILAESRIVNNGAKLGPVGSRIVAEVIGGLLAADSQSYYRRSWTPDGGSFRAQDLLKEAGVLPTP